MNRSVIRSVSDDRNGNQNLEIGDSVDVPGGMHGVIKFLGEVKGKKGVFAGVELAREWAARGKNDGDVDGTRYFSTTIKGAGIFLPSSKAYKRLSPTLSSGDSMPPTPTSPAVYTKGDTNTYTPPTSTIAPKLNQSVGPGRVPSPTMKSKRPSLPRPESPTRKLATTPQPRPSTGKPNFSRSMISAPRVAASPTPNKLGGSVRGTRPVVGDPGKRNITATTTPRQAVRKPTGSYAPSSRSESRSGSRLGPESMFDEDDESTPVGTAKHMPPLKTPSRRSADESEELRQLKAQLDERDEQLEKYAMDLEEMQNSIAELQTATPKFPSGTTRSSRGSGIDDLDAPSLRALVREKNEKIAALTQEFDTHRADFRDTIDILEHTSDETNRHYEERIAALEGELKMQTNREDDVESVAQQLVQLEKHVEELEEGLEDSRRGESEARAEVEHLRGEVERGRAELRREREKAASVRATNTNNETLSDATWKREIAHRDNEINGLKAIIHSLSRDATPAGASGPNSPRSSRRSRHHESGGSIPNGPPAVDTQLAEERQARERLEREIKSLESLVDKKTYREEELEHEIQRLQQSKRGSASSTNHNNNNRSSANNRNSNINNTSNRSVSNYSSHRSADVTPKQPADEENSPDPAEEDDDDEKWCELCETRGHDILHCSSMSASTASPQHHQGHAQTPRSAKPTHNNNNTHDTPTQKAAPISSPSHGPGHGLGLGLASANNAFRSPPPSHPNFTSGSGNASDMSAAVPGKESGIVDAGKWCALCERDGHDSVDCPFDNEF